MQKQGNLNNSVNVFFCQSEPDFIFFFFSQATGGLKCLFHSNIISLFVLLCVLPVVCVCEI